MQTRLKLDIIIGLVRIARLRPYYYRNKFGVELGCCGIMLFITKKEECTHCQDDERWYATLLRFIGGDKV